MAPLLHPVWAAQCGQTAPVDEEIRRLFLETVEALEAVLIAVQVDRPVPWTVEGGARDFATREAVRRLIRLRQAVQESTGGSE